MRSPSSRPASPTRTRPRSESVLRVEVADRIAVVTLDRPERRNALNGALIARIPEVMASLDADDGVDVVVLTGSDPAFRAGADLKEAGEGGGVLADLSVVPPRGLFHAMS